MATKKKKSTKKIAKKVANKKKSTSKKVAPKRRKKIQETNPEIIFDSKVGKTNALFVANPEPAVQNNNQQLIDPAIEEALKEFDNLEKIKEPAQPPTQPLPQKKSFWHKFFKI